MLSLEHNLLKLDKLANFGLFKLSFYSSNLNSYSFFVTRLDINHVSIEKVSCFLTLLAMTII